MPKQIRDLVDGPPLADELRRQAMAYQVSTDDRGQCDADPPECGAHDPGNDSAPLDRADRRTMLQKYTLAAALGPGTKDIISERLARFLYERYDAIALGFGPANNHLGAAPPDIVELERFELLVA
jgi:hypothetical protein